MKYNYFMDFKLGIYGSGEKCIKMNNVKAYAAYADEKIRRYSSSGGIFSVIATRFDVIYGVAMTEDCYGCEFVRIENEINPLRGSKYFQAKMGDTYKKVKNDLLNGKRVLFTGTGCQINGLSLFLGKDYANLTLMDVVCHGVPSPKLWKSYIQFQEEKYGKIKNVNFRSKDLSWQKFGMKENGRYIPMYEDVFMRMFLKNLCLRPSCYDCHAKYYKKADITIGDFWGIEKILSEMNDGMGTSLVICRTQKGIDIFKAIKGDIKYKEVGYKEAVRHNVAEYMSVERPEERDSFYSDLSNLSFTEMIKKYASVSLKQKIKNTIKNLIGMFKRKFKGNIN